MNRDRQARWDAVGLRTISTKLTVEEAREFRRLCLARYTTPYAVVQSLVLEWMHARRPKGPGWR